MAEERPQLSREQVQELIEAARERLAERRAEMAQEHHQIRSIAQRYYATVPAVAQQREAERERPPPEG